MSKYIVLVLITFLNSINLMINANEKHLVIGICSYNNKNWYEKNLKSVFSQNYENFRVIYIDDNSPDGTGDLVENYLKVHNLENRVTLIKNKTRKNLGANHYNIIHSSYDDEIIVILDGDDWFAHNNVLQKVNEVYQDDNIWMSFGTK
ncbi:MAG: glycosyltransferase family A protein, partial [Bacteroidota bacterium]